MRYWQFFDDWLLDGYRDIVRGYGRPELIHTDQNLPDPIQQTVYKTADGRYRMWYRGFVHVHVDQLKPLIDQGHKLTHEPDNGYVHLKSLFYAESDDGLNFYPVEVPAKDPRFPDRTDVIDLPRYCWSKGLVNTDVLREVYYDDHDKDEQRRYKALTLTGRIFTSPDGFHWTDTDTQAIKTPGNAGSDTDNHIRYNPKTGRYQAMSRPGHWDRRVALTESDDDDPMQWSAWPRVVFQPDALDPACHQFQGFPYYQYEDMWVGWLQHFDTPIEERRMRRKMIQKFREELCYSYDGVSWQRTRHIFMPKPDPPNHGNAQFVTRNYVDEGDHLKLYSAGTLIAGDLGGGASRRLRERGIELGNTPERAILVYKLRKDGFCYLEPRAGYGYLWTRGFVPQDGDFTCNLLAPYGQVRMQLSDLENRPLPGFSFDEFDPLTGDGWQLQPRWKYADLAQAVGQWCRLEIELFDARLYAIRWNIKLAYSKPDCLIEHL